MRRSAIASQDHSSTQKSRRNTPPRIVTSQEIGRAEILVRDWVTGHPQVLKGYTVKVMTWNLLAQCLVRRDLFPESDCLKAIQRDSMLIRELLTYSPDIICLQEVDRLDKLLPPLCNASYKETYAAGLGKRHGCMILHRDNIFERVEQHTVHYDELDVKQGGDERERKGSSRRTTNIGLIVALRRRDQPEHGYVIATTHLFWHPAYTYERVRQAGLLLREVSRFQKVHALQPWTCILAGDFNSTPTDATYSLLVGDPLTTQQANEIAISRVVHSSIDPSVSTTTAGPNAGDEDSASKGEDSVIANARKAAKGDGLLSDEELRSLFLHHGSLRSVYDEGQRMTSSEHDNVIGNRENFCPSRKGRFEPMWTSYTHFWKTTLDYIFFLDPKDKQHEVSGFLKTHRTSALKEGLPLKGVCASDHISLVGEIGPRVLDYDTN